MMIFVHEMRMSFTRPKLLAILAAAIRHSFVSVTMVVNLSKNGCVGDFGSRCVQIGARSMRMRQHRVCQEGQRDKDAD